MATKKYIELQEFSDEELVNELKETESKYQKLQFDHSVKGLDNPMVIRAVRRDIARLNTEIRKREINAMTPEQISKRSKIRKRRRNS
ncbi:MAG TPA: 50S ribosomal protein L29 [Saprospiraceae bacterium]|nr:50S ribosomal protein L29 [Saprospiraceae bacterium]